MDYRWVGVRWAGRSAGRNRIGHTTAPHRRAVRRYTPVVARGFPPGVYRRWARATAPHGRQHDLLVGPNGVVWAPTVEGAPEYTTVGYTPGVVELGSTQPLRWAAVGATVCGVGWYASAPGTGVRVLRHRADHVECRLPSRVHRWLTADQCATLGVAANSGVRHVHYTKAGDSFVAGWRPHTRGVAMNPVDHPHGGGQGKTAGGGPGMTPWGQLTKGYKTVRSRAA